MTMSYTNKLMYALAMLCSVTFSFHAKADKTESEQPTQLESSVKNPLRVQPFKTEIEEVELARVLRAAFVTVFQTQPSANRLAMAWAQVALENGRGKHSYNFNLGNIWPGPDQQYYLASDGNKYRSFLTHVDAAGAYWYVIKACTAAMRSFEAGLARQATIDLHNCNYFGAEIDAYAEAMGGLFWEAKNKILMKM